MAEPRVMYSFPAITRQEKRKQREQKQEQMWKHPETLHLDMMCHTNDIDNSGVCLQHYVQKYETGDITSFPSVSAISDGSRLKVVGSIVIKYDSARVVLVQGNRVNTWKDHDFQVLKAAVDVWLDEAN